MPSVPEEKINAPESTRSLMSESESDFAFGRSASEIREGAEMLAGMLGDSQDGDSQGDFEFDTAILHEGGESYDESNDSSQSAY